MRFRGPPALVHKHEKLIRRGRCFNDLRLFSREPIAQIIRPSRVNDVKSTTLEARCGIASGGKDVQLTG